MVKISTLMLFMFLMISPCFATTWTPYHVYTATDTVSNTNLNGNYNSLGNILNGGLDNSNANTGSGYRFFQTVGSLPAFGNQGAVYFLTAGNTLNFDTGTSFVQTLTVPASTTQGNTIYYGAGGWTTLSPGTSGQLLETQGAGANPLWETVNYATFPAPYVKVSNTQTQNTGGGTASSGAWNVATLNTKDADTQSIASLGSNQVTLPAGTYIVQGSQPFHFTANSQARLYNVTSSSVLLNGTSVDSSTAGGADGVDGYSMIQGVITLSTSSALEIEYQVSTSASSSGLGLAANFGTEVYAQLSFTKIQ